MAGMLGRPVSWLRSLPRPACVSSEFTARSLGGKAFSRHLTALERVRIGATGRLGRGGRSAGLGGLSQAPPNEEPQQRGRPGDQDTCACRRPSWAPGQSGQARRLSGCSRRHLGRHRQGETCRQVSWHSRSPARLITSAEKNSVWAPAVFHVGPPLPGPGSHHAPPAPPAPVPTRSGRPSSSRVVVTVYRGPGGVRAPRLSTSTLPDRPTQSPRKPGLRGALAAVSGSVWKAVVFTSQHPCESGGAARFPLGSHTDLGAVRSQGLGSAQDCGSVLPGITPAACGLWRGSAVGFRKSEDITPQGVCLASLATPSRQASHLKQNEKARQKESADQTTRAARPPLCRAPVSSSWQSSSAEEVSTAHLSPLHSHLPVGQPFTQRQRQWIFLPVSIFL